MSVKWKSGCAVILLAGAYSGASAFDSTTLELLTGNQSEVIRLGLRSPTNVKFAPFPQSKVTLAWQYSLAYWRENRPENDPSRSESLIDLGLTPIWRLGSPNAAGWYGEAGIGAHILSKHYNNNGREFSTKFQFASHLGGGYAFEDHWMLAVKVEHVSNGGIKHPNPGANFIGVQIGRRF